MHAYMSAASRGDERLGFRFKGSGRAVRKPARGIWDWFPNTAGSGLHRSTNKHPHRPPAELGNRRQGNLLNASEGASAAASAVFAHPARGRPERKSAPTCH
eukprot:1187213-Prorocentrum_minimum.AAC.1